MRTHFTLRHALILVLLLCLASIAVGAALADDSTALTPAQDQIDDQTVWTLQPIQPLTTTGPITPTVYPLTNTFPPPPEPGEAPYRVAYTNQYVAWDADADITAGANWFNVVFVDSVRNVVLDNGWYAPNGSDFAGYEDAVCDAVVCVVKPRSQLSITVDGIYLTDEVHVDVQVQAIFYDEDTGVVTPLSDFFTLTSFEIDPPPASLDLAGALTSTTSPGRPTISVRGMTFTVPDPNTGIENSVEPDWYRVYVVVPPGVSRNVYGPAVDQYYQVDPSCPDEAESCELLPWGERPVLYSGNGYQFWLQGYSTELHAFTPWFTISPPGGTSIEAPIGNLDTGMAIGGTYEVVGSSFATNPYAPTSQWQPCGTTPTGIQTVGNPICDNNRPLVHIAPDLGGVGAEWVHVLLWSPETSQLVVDRWFNVNDFVQELDGAFFDCGYGFGAGEFDDLTCLYGTPRLSPDRSYIWMFQVYSVAGYLNGGYSGNFTREDSYVDSSGNSFAEFSISTYPDTRNLASDG